MAGDRINILAGADIQVEPDGSGIFLIVRVTPGIFARLAELGAWDGASMVGADSEADAYDEDSVGAWLASLEGRAKGLVSLPGHLSFAPANDGADLQLLLPQAMGTGDAVQFGAGKFGKLLGAAGSNFTVSNVGAGAGPSATTGSFSLVGTGFMVAVTLTVAGAPTGGNLEVATINFPVAYASAPRVVMIPTSRQAWALQAANATACNVPDADVSTTGFKLRSGVTTPLVDGTQYSWVFMVFGA